MAIILTSEAATAPVSEAWAVRIDSPTDHSLLVSGMDVGPSGAVFLVGPYRNGGYYNRDILITRRSSSGALVWQRTYQPPEGPSASESAIGLVARGTNVYVAGTITLTNGRTDFLILKYRDNGDLEWAARSEGRGYGISGLAVDAQGNVLILGAGLLVLKYGPTGTLLWEYSHDGSQSGGGRSAEMRVDEAGNIYVAGSAGASTAVAEPITLKLAPDGQQLWTALETANLDGGTVNALDVDSVGNVVTVARDQLYGFAWKYDAHGNRQWMVRYRDEVSSAYPLDARFDASGNIIVIAYGGLVIKYAADGQQLWASRFFNPNQPGYVHSMDLDSGGNAYVIRSSYSDVVTVKVNPDGAQLWSVTYNSQENADDSGEFIKVTPSGDIFVSGRSFYSGQTFVSLVKYTQQPVTGLATAVVTPAFQVVDPGTNVVLTAETTGPGPIHFQWRKNGALIQDATSSTLALSNVQALDRGDYSVIVSNLAGVTVSPEARLLVRVQPEVIVSPAETLAYIGTDTAFAASVAGNDFATLQWRHNGTNIIGATNETFQLLNLNAGMAGAYDIVVSTFGGSTTSSPAALRISHAVELLQTTPYRSFVWNSETAPFLQVLPGGESLLAAGSNHVMGSTIVLQKRATNGEPLWAVAFDNSEYTNGRPTRLLLDAAGNIFISALFGRQYYPDALGVLKYNSNGQLLWSRFITGTNLWSSIHGFAVDAQGNSAFSILGEVGTKLVRYNHAGDLQWTFDNPSPEDDGTTVAVSASGDTFLGTSLHVGGHVEIRLRKFDSAGAIAWTVPSPEGLHNWLGALAVDSGGNLIVAGIGEPPLGAEGWLFVQKYSPAGQKLWERRFGTAPREFNYIAALLVDSADEMTLLTRSDDDYDFGEESAIIRIRPDGQVRYHTKEQQILVSSPAHLALDNFGNAYVSGWGGRIVTEADAVTAKYDAFGRRVWLVHYDGGKLSWQYSLAIGADAAGNIRVLALEETQSDQSSVFSLLHYRQLDPASTFHLQLIPDPGGKFHLATPTQEPYRIQASADLQNWDTLTEAETQQLLQPGANSFAELTKRFFRLILIE